MRSRFSCGSSSSWCCIVMWGICFVIIIIMWLWEICFVLIIIMLYCIVRDLFCDHLDHLDVDCIVRDLSTQLELRQFRRRKSSAPSPVSPQVERHWDRVMLLGETVREWCYWDSIPDFFNSFFLWPRASLPKIILQGQSYAKGFFNNISFFCTYSLTKITKRVLCGLQIADSPYQR